MQRLCSIEGCDRPHLARGWCATHYQRWRTTGEVGAGPLRVIRYVEGAREKPCSKCGVTKPLDDFWTEPRKRDGRHSACKECMHVQQRDRTLRRKYGIGSAEYDALVEAQQGRCGVCGEPDARRPLVVDHCHRSGQVRALLCDRCNRLLGVADDDIALLEHAIQFLHKHRGPTAPK